MSKNIQPNVNVGITKIIIIMDSSEIFDSLCLKILQLLYGRTLVDRTSIGKILDDLNSLNYRYPIVKSPTRAVLVVNQCCSCIHPDDDLLITKCVQLMANLIVNQSLSVEGRTLTVLIKWCLQTIKTSNNIVVLDVLKVLEALIRNNVENIPALLDRITKEIHSKIEEEMTLKSSEVSQEIILASLKCLETTTIISADAQHLESFFPYLERCAEIFMSFLCNNNKHLKNSILEVKMLETSLIGLQNIVVVHGHFLHKELGLVLGIIKTYMLYGIKNVDYMSPEKLMPSTLSVPEVNPALVREKTGGKVPKQRKYRNLNNKRKEKKNQEDNFENKSSGYIPATTSLDYNSDSGLGCASSLSSRLKTSDSDFSDTEGGKLAKLTHSYNKVRQASHNLFCSVVKNTEKATIFTYWSCFIPESSSSGKHNLLTCILRDPSTRGKMCASQALLSLLTSAKMYLSQAEWSDKASSFTPFSMMLGLTLIEIHKNLCLALNQFCVPVLTQVLKCLAALVQASPYHRLPHGLITKIVRNVKGLISHRDASVQVTALIVTGCVLASEPALPETEQAMSRIQRKEDALQSTTVNQENIQSPAVGASCDDFDYAQFSSDEEDERAVVEVDSIPWLLQKCLRNLGITFEDCRAQEISEKIVPAPVKLESLQILSAMSRNYFESLVLPHLGYITKALELSLVDKYDDLRLHAGRAVDFLSHAFSGVAEHEGSTQYLNFWQVLLDGPLVSLIQNEQQAALQVVGCDCIGSIGPHIFQQFRRDKQILCVTLLFACTKNEDSTVRAAAVRALGLCVLYPALREDAGFVVDTAESILKALNDDNISVRVKASWSLANLSDALVLNSKSRESVDETFPDEIFLSLLEASITSSNDNEKIKMNVVRAIGNLMQLVDAALLKTSQFKNASERALNALIKASTTGSNMKVRWNACYALGNALKNPALYTELDTNAWQSSAFTKLADMVVAFKNFKVRINATLALSSPTARQHYGQHFIPVWKALLQSLENSQNIEDFMEYKHRDNLVEQICLSLGHLTTLLTKEDLPQLENLLNLYLDIFKLHMHKVLERLVPEKSTNLVSATCSLSSLESRTDINGAAEKRVLECLRTIFVLQ